MKFTSLALLSLTVQSVNGFAFVSAQNSCAAGLTCLSAFPTEVSGEVATESFRLNYKDESGNAISPWHDIPLKDEDGNYNFVVEIPRYTKAKMEVATKEDLNPISQDMKKGKLRDYHGPIFWNYGCLPQTWENPNEEHPDLKVFGDNGFLTPSYPDDLVRFLFQHISCSRCKRT